ncbi:hypothetical protein HXX01_00925 [Candidatus Nomurabacteria bacterium]|nr:hypothetical protein [Candidatus Nomurabacteria bacterium]
MDEILELLKQRRFVEIYGLRTIDKNFMTREEMIAIFDHFDAFWEYDGPPTAQRTHAKLKSEKHSNGFIACKNVLQKTLMCKIFGLEIFKRLPVELNGFPLDKIDVVVSSAYSAITLGYEVSSLISKKNPNVEYIPVEKDKDDKPTVIRGGIDPSKNVLIINELMTTGGGSTWETKQAVLKCNGEGNPVPNIIEPAIVLIHRSKDWELIDGSKVRPIFHFDMEDWDVPNGEECPLCKAGSEAIKPKVGNNWNLIHGRV